MGKRKEMREAHNKIMIDVNDFIMKYAASVLGEDRNDLAQTIYNAAKDDIKGLDQLFNDDGFGRTQRYTNIAIGFASNLNHSEGQEAKEQGEEIANEAIQYLGNNADYFNNWEKE